MAGDSSAEGDRQPAVRIGLRTDRVRYAPGDTISATLTASPNGRQPARLRFANSQRCDFEIVDVAGAVVWRWGAERMFAQMTAEVVVTPDRPLVCAERFASPQLPGSYRIVGRLTSSDSLLRAEAAITVQ